MQTRVYRAAAWGWILGTGLTLVGIYATWVPIDHLNSGVPWLVSNGRYSHGLHTASRNEMVWLAVEYSFFWLVGLLVLYVCALRSVTLDTDGVIVRMAFKGTTFMEPYGELTSFTKKVNRQNGTTYKLSSRNGKSVLLSNVYGKLDDMVSQILLRAPQLGYVHGTDDSANS